MYTHKILHIDLEVQNPSETGKRDPGYKALLFNIAQSSGFRGCGYFPFLTYANCEQLRGIDKNFLKCYEAGFMCTPN